MNYVIVIHSAPIGFSWGNSSLFIYFFGRILHCITIIRGQSASYYSYTTVVEYNLPWLPQQQSVYVRIHDNANPIYIHFQLTILAVHNFHIDRSTLLHSSIG